MIEISLFSAILIGSRIHGADDKKIIMSKHEVKSINSENTNNLLLEYLKLMHWSSAEEDSSLGVNRMTNKSSEHSQIMLWFIR